MKVASKDRVVVEYVSIEYPRVALSSAVEKAWLSL